MTLAAAQVNALDPGQLASLRTAARADDSQALRKSAQQFEALFTQMMLKSMRDALPGDSGLGQQGDVYQGMYDQQLSLSLSSGKGMGLADLLVQQLTQAKLTQVQSAAATTTGNDGTVPANRGAATSAAKASGAAGDDPADHRAFIDTIRPHAERAARELGVPARAIMAQAALETGWGQHVMRDADGGASFNLFGIKASKSWSGDRVQASTQEFRDGRFGTEQAAFRSYDGMAAAFDDYVGFLKHNPRYLQALRAGASDGVAGFAQGLQQAGYATDPGYARKLVGVAYGSNMNAALSRAVDTAPAATRAQVST